MAFLTLFFFIILVGYLFIRLIPWFLAFRIRKMQQHGPTQERTEFKRSRKKHIGRNTGEYIDYEEIKD